MRPGANVYVAVDLCNAVPGRLIIEPTARSDVRPRRCSPKLEYFTSLESATFAPSETGFTALTLLNSWVGAPFQDEQRGPR